MDTGGSRFVRDGQSWRVGTALDVKWIVDATGPGLAITSAIPPIYDAYATVVEPDDDRAAHEGALLDALVDQSPNQQWWLGYLDTGSDDVFVPSGSTIQMYTSWGYGLFQAGPEQARTWRPDSARGTLPDLMFPADRSWLVSHLWDDDWRCIGGTDEFVGRVERACGSLVRRVGVLGSATPTGHVAR